MKYDYLTADNAETPHVALLTGDGEEKLLTLPYTPDNEDLIIELTIRLNGAEVCGFKTR